MPPVKAPSIGAGDVYDRGMHGEPVFDEAAALGECPVWDHRTELLWWVDIDGRVVWRGDPAHGTAESFPSSGRPAAIALTPDPSVILVAQDGELAWLLNGEYHRWVLLEDLPGNRLNDGRVAPDGTFWVGSMHADTSLRIGSGVLYRVSPSGESTVARTGVGVSNGLAFSPKGEWMYFADTATNTVERHAYPTTAVPPSPPFADTYSLAGKPDGGCVDEDGRYWLAGVHGSALYCYTAEGELDLVVDLPVARPTRATFGGPDLRQLFVTSIGSRPGTPDGGHGLDGRLLVLDVGARGLPEHVFPAAPTKQRISDMAT